MSFFCFSLCTGMRLNEITALKWQDIDYINNVIRVNKTVSWKEGGGIEETLPKSDTSNRDIPMNDTIKKNLADAENQNVHGLRGNPCEKDG